MKRAAEVVLALDIGSSSTRAALFDQRGRTVPGTDARRKYSLTYTSEGGAELSPIALRRAVGACLRGTLRRSRSQRRIAAVGGSAFWHGLLGLDRKGQPITPVFTWADSRCTTDAEVLLREFDEQTIQEETGCMLRASYWPAKLRWLWRIDRQLFQKVHRWVSPPDWIFEKIFGAVGTSHSMASATGLYDLRTKSWHDELCRACRIDSEQLDALRESSDHGAVNSSELRNARVFNPIGDGAAGNLGSGADTAGRVAINAGTSAAVRILEVDGRQRVPLGLFRYAVDQKRAVVGGAVSNAGNLHQWCVQQLQLGMAEGRALSRTAAAIDDLTILPFWVKERAPTWPENLPGAIVGLTQSTDAAAIFRAAMCATFYRLADILELLEQNAGRAKQVIVSGGILRSKPSLVLLADSLGRDICISAEKEASLRGAAVYVLEKLGHAPAPLPKPKIIRHNSNLAAKHRVRRERQRGLEEQLSIKTPR
ncbi:MAG TPA: gluconokinase [Chthoniobacterales bacterium]|nr:gluconokinase [Chthoniobacterales bacterium]